MATASSSLLNKFRGCLVGGYVSDCIAQPFLGKALIERKDLNNYFRQQMEPKVKVPLKPCTEVSAMTKATALSFIHCKDFKLQDLARRYTFEYFVQSTLGSRHPLHNVFLGLKNSNYGDPFGPAQKFQGKVSLGNGAATRIAPVALFFHNHFDHIVDKATMSSKITHANKFGYRGAILQALAIDQALNLKENQRFDHNEYLEDLILKMRAVEGVKKNDKQESSPESYIQKLEVVKSFLRNSEPPPVEDIRNILGAHENALQSVPTAVYCFLAAQNPIPGIDSDNLFQRATQFAMSLGGDNNIEIACMAASIAGAHVGFEAIPKELLKHCQGIDSILQMANDLHETYVSSEASKIYKLKMIMADIYLVPKVVARNELNFLSTKNILNSGEEG